MIRDVESLTVGPTGHIAPGTLVRTPDGRVWCRGEEEIGGWEFVPAAVATMLAEAVERSDRWEEGVKVAYAYFCATFTKSPTTKGTTHDALMDCMYRLERDGILPDSETHGRR